MTFALLLDSECAKKSFAVVRIIPSEPSSLTRACCKKKGELMVVPILSDSISDGDLSPVTIIVCSGRAYIPVNGYMSCIWSSLNADVDKNTTLQCESDMINPVLRAITSIAPAIVFPFADVQT